MSGDKRVEFPKFATEEMHVFGMTMTEAGILAGSMSGVVLTRQLIVSAFIGFVLWRIYLWYKDKGQTNIALQLVYRLGFYVPKSHVFPEPKVDSFRE
jgi:type IV secretory pathway VirB3-like protein